MSALESSEVGGGGTGFSQLFACPGPFSFPPQRDPAESPPPSVAAFHPRNTNTLSYVLPSSVTWHEQIPSRGFRIPIPLGGSTPSALHKPKRIWPSHGGVRIFPLGRGLQVIYGNLFYPQISANLKGLERSFRNSLSFRRRGRRSCSS